MLLVSVPGYAQELTIRYFDVGQGDAALVTTPNGKSILIDAGPDAETVLEKLKQLRVDTIDLMIASHNHADHIGGFPSILSAIPVKHYLDNGVVATTSIYDATIRAVEGTKAVYLRPTNRRIEVDSVLLRVLAGDSTVETQNNASVGVLLTFGKFSALFTGDAEIPERRHWLENDSLPEVAVLKVSHHGSVNGTDSAWVASLHPQLAVISVGAGNRYGHPSPMTLEILAKAGVEVLRTDLVGTIQLNAKLNGQFRVSTSGNSRD